MIYIYISSFFSIGYNSHNIEGFLKIIILEHVYCQIWLNIFIDDCHLNNITKLKEKNRTNVRDHIGENKNLQNFKNGHIFYIMKIILLKT